MSGEKDRLGEKVEEEREIEQIQQIVPPDGGFWAWLVMFSCFCCNGIIFGIINTFGILFVKLRSDLEEQGVKDAAFKCSLVGSLTIGATFFLSFFVGILADKIGLRVTAVIGGVISTVGMGLSAIFYHKIEVLYFSYGILFGTGSSLAYTPSLTILGHYFRRHMGVVNGVVTAGSSVFTVALSIINQHILEEHGLNACLLFFTGLSSLLIVCSLTFIPILPTPPPIQKSNASSKAGEVLEKLVYLDNWRNKRYVIWSLAIPAALFGYFVPYVHLVQFAKNLPIDADPDANKMKATSLVTCIGITSGLGRLIFGKMADMAIFKRNGNRIILQQLAFVSIGVCTMLLTAAPHFSTYKYEALMLFCCLMGLFDGCFITMLGPIAFDICGPAGAGQGIGFLLALCSIPLTIGPPVAGLIYDHVGDYSGAFIGAGIPPLVGAALMLTIRFFPQQDSSPLTLEKRNQDETKKSLLEIPA